MGNKLKFRYGEIYCGPGGLALGAMKSKIKKGDKKFEIVHSWSNDYDGDSCKTYRKNICPNVPDSVFHKDVRELQIKSLTPIDIFAYGFPCNDFSIVGEHKGIDGEYGPLLFIRCKDYQPF